MAVRGSATIAQGGNRFTMIVLGISGFENAVPFKKSHWPGLEEREYRISQGHDSAAALVVDGEIIAAAAEERFSRKKHTGSFPGWRNPVLPVGSAASSREISMRLLTASTILLTARSI